MFPQLPIAKGDEHPELIFRNVTRVAHLVHAYGHPKGRDDCTPIDYVLWGFIRIATNFAGQGLHDVLLA